MTMHIVRGMLDTRKSAPTKKEIREAEENNRIRRRNNMLPTVGIKPGNNGFQPLRQSATIRRGGCMDFLAHESLPDTVNMAPVHSIMDPRSLANESPETQAAIIAKSKCIAPAYSKGAYQLITPGMDLSDLGKKK